MSYSHQQQSVKLLASLLALVILSACAAPKEKFTARYWPTPEKKTEYPELQYQEIKDRPSFGVAFQGGGNRAAPAALGQLRALHRLGWIDKVRYISAVSGGSWTSIPYTYLKQTYSEDVFLGRFHSPGDVAKRLPSMIEGNLSPEFHDSSMLGAMEDAAITANYFAALFGLRMDEAFSDALSKIYLKPFGLGRTKGNAPDSLFTWSNEDRKRILKNNVRFEKTEIHYVERKRPYLIVGGTVLAKRINPDPTEKYLLEMTPLYTGVPWKAGPNQKSPAKIPLGGGYVESYGYDYITDNVKEGSKVKSLTLRDPIIGNLTDRSRLNFSLSNVAAISGAAPVETIISIPLLNLLFSNMGFPEHFVPTDMVVPKQTGWSTKEGEIYEKEWAHGDGGHEDNLGLVSLLEREVENIIVFANSYAPLGKDKYIKGFKENNPDEKQSMIEICKDGLSKHENKLPEIDNVDDRLKMCLEMAGDDLPTFFLRTEASIHNAGLVLQENVLLPENKQELRGYYDLLSIAEELKENKLISCRRYTYTSQLDLSLGRKEPRTYHPKICIIFLGMDEDWKKSIKGTTESENMTVSDVKNIQVALDLNENWQPKHDKRKSFGSSGFPHLGTFNDQKGRIIKIKPERLYALSNFTAWKLIEHSKELKYFFDQKLDLPSNGAHEVEEALTLSVLH
ncbi:hypothetical protein [Sneathiella limimaris]|uniref:hypothetical protein n=1 Tax=Sneathiella limimaris TaxID=1964213 RepID=UPI00146BF9BA|nr:hypothetical protein [Sneathiella limimaris]